MAKLYLKFRQKSFNCTHFIRPIRRRRLGRHLMSSCHRPLSLQFSTASQRSPAFQRNHIEKSGTFSSATLVSGPKVPPPNESRDNVHCSAVWTKFNLPSGSSHDLPLGGGLAPSNHSPHCTQFNLLLRERNSTSCCLHGHTPPYGHSISLELDEQPLELSSDEKESC